MKLVSLDIDGVLADFFNGFKDYLSKEGIIVTSHEQAYDLFWVHKGLKSPIYKKITNNSKTSQDFWNLTCLCSEKEKRIIEDNADRIIFVSSRNVKVYNITYHWLQTTFNINTPKLICGAIDKPSICNGLNIKSHLDDIYLHAHTIAKRTLCRSYLLTNIFNVKYKITNKNGITRVNTVLEYLEREL